MRAQFYYDQNKSTEDTCKRAIIGVGGAGLNTLNEVLKYRSDLTACAAVNRDMASLTKSSAAKKLYLNANSAEQIKASIEPHRHAIHEILQGKELLLLLAGMGGITGTHASPSIVEIAAELKVPTIAFIIRPFNFEGENRARLAQEGVESLIEAGATVRTYSNQNLIHSVPKGTSMFEGLRLVDQEVLGLIESFSWPTEGEII